MKGRDTLNDCDGMLHARAEFVGMATELLNDVMLLLTCAVKAGVSIDAADATLIVQLAQKIRDGSALTAAEEASLLAHYARLANLVKPVTVESLKAVSNASNSLTGRPIAARTIRHYMTYAIATFVALVMVQIYWLIGDGLIQAIDNGRTQLASYVAQSHGYRAAQTNSSAAIGTASPPIGVTGQGGQFPVMPKVNPTDSNPILFQATQNESLSQIVAVLLGYHQALTGWTRVWRFFVTPWMLHGSDYKTNSLLETKAMPGGMHQTPIGEGSLRLSLEGELIIARMEVEAVFALQALQQFILPFLYGLLGTLVYVLRSLGSEIRQMTYTANMNYGYRLRVIIGALAGVAIAWFLQSKSISALALAFLAGYSVEVLFSAMDRLVKALSDDSGQGEKAVTATVR